MNPRPSRTVPTCLAALALAGCSPPTSERRASTAQALTVSPAFEVDRSTTEPATTVATDLGAAFNGADHLVAWVDASRVVMMARVSAAGVVRDPLGVVLGPAIPTGFGASSDPPAVASDGAGFLVAWTSRSNEVRAARVDAEGAVLDPGGFVVTASGAGPVAVGSAAGYLVAWRDARNGPTTGTDYFAARVGRDGVLRDPAGLPALVAPGEQSRAALATDGAGWLLACEDGPGGDIRVGRLDAGGAALDGAGRRVAVTVRARRRPSVAWSGAGYLLAWSDQTASGSLTPGLYAQVIAPSGAVVGPEAIPLGFVANGATVAPDADGWRVAGDGAPGLLWTRVSAAGAVLDRPARTAAAAVGGAPTLSGRGGASGYLLSFRTEATGAAAQRLAGDGTAAGAVFGLNFRAPSQDRPGVATDGTGFLLTWRDAPASGEAYRAQRLSPTGALLDAVATLPASSTGFAADFGGTGYLLAWHDSNGLNQRTRAAPLSSANVLGPGGSYVGTSANSVPGRPRVAAGPGGFAVAWGQFPGGSGNGLNYLSLLPVSAAGVPLGGAPARLTGTARSDVAPGLSFDGANFLAAFVDTPTAAPDGRCFGARVRRVTPAGDLLEATPVLLTGSACDVTGAGAASDGANHLVAWTSPAGLFVTRVSPAGAALDATPRAVTLTPSRSPVVSFDGAAFVVVWEDSRGGNADIYAARVSPAGAVLDPGGVPVTQEAVAEETPTIASTRTGRTLVAYTRRTSATAARVRGRFVTFDEAGTDAGIIDAGAPTPDVIATIDATTPDAAMVDATQADVPRDAGPAVDAGGPAVDAGGPADVPPSVDASTPLDEDGGCSVGRRGATAPGAWALALVALAAWRRPRRVRRP
jgi:hypothetical protein